MHLCCLQRTIGSVAPRLHRQVVVSRTRFYFALAAAASMCIYLIRSRRPPKCSATCMTWCSWRRCGRCLAARTLLKCISVAATLSSGPLCCRCRLLEDFQAVQGASVTVCAKASDAAHFECLSPPAPSLGKRMAAACSLNISRAAHAQYARELLVTTRLLCGHRHGHRGTMEKR